MSNILPTFVISVPQDRLLPAGRDWLWLAGIVAVHAALLAGAVLGPGRAKPPVAPPAVIGMLLAARPPAEAVLPKPLPAAPAPAKPRVVPRPRHTPLPLVPNAPPSERAVAAPALQSVQPDQSQAAPAAPVTVAAPSTSVPGPMPMPMPVIPPRTDAAHLNNPAPAYPAVSRRLGEQGRALFDVYILPDGSVGEVKLKRSSGYARLDEAAFGAVRRWRYVPARRGDEAIPYWYVQPITFSLDG